MSRPTASDTHSSPTTFDTLADAEPVPPQWVLEAFGSSPTQLGLGPHVCGTASDDLVLLKTRIEHVTRLSPDVMRAQVTEAYQRLNSAIATTGRQPIRFWNFIPDLGQAIGPGLDRYMVFNAGRYDAFLLASRGEQAFVSSLATASAVGIGQTNLVVYCLGSISPGTPVENPRQKSSWLYSSRYGPLPPCFSRAIFTTIAGRPRLLIGGTASIVGEESRHEMNAAAQLDETLQNLESLVSAAAATRAADASHALERLIDIRVYVTSLDHADFIRHEVSRRCPQADRVELVRARLCRPELLLEIEAVADV